MKPFHWMLPLLLIAGPALAGHEHEPLRRSVNVSGQGEVSVTPDRAQLSLGVETSNVELKLAEAEVNKVVRAYLAEAKKLGIKDEQISTAGISISPEYVWDEKDRRQKFNGYRASRQIVVRVEDLNKIGDQILSATKVGVNQVSAPQLYSTKAVEMSRQALVKATEDARSKAQLLASSLGVKLGAVRSISANDGHPSPPVLYKAMAMRADGAESGNTEMGFASGEIKYSANVNADFDLVTAEPTAK